MKTMELNQTSQSLVENKVLDTLVLEFQEMDKKVVALENKVVMEFLQFPEEDLRIMGLLKDTPKKIRKGRGRRPILESEIKEAQEHCDCATDCAIYLNVGYTNYRKWAKTYGIFKINPWGRGDKKGHREHNKGKYPLNRILEGKFPDYPVNKLKEKLIRSGIKKTECENCGFDEHRITDQKIPLLISFLDSNEKNHLLSNIEILCYNCMFLIGGEYIQKGNVGFDLPDPDIIQGYS